MTMKRTIVMGLSGAALILAGGVALAAGQYGKIWRQRHRDQARQYQPL